MESVVGLLKEKLGSSASGPHAAVPPTPDRGRSRCFAKAGWVLGGPGVGASLWSLFSSRIPTFGWFESQQVSVCLNLVVKHDDCTTACSETAIPQVWVGF